MSWASTRSLHPEQWTDPEFLACSPLARLLALALRNEADDNGAFEWNPGKLKMQLLPGDDCEVSGLLAELEQTLLMPVSDRRQLNDLPDETWTRLSIEFYKDAADAVFKALED